MAAGTYSEEVKVNTVNLIKSITILGANATTVPTSNVVDGTVVSGGGIYIGTDSVAVIENNITVKGITFYGGKGLLLGNIQTITVENNKFLNISETFNPSTTNVAAIAVIDPYAGGQITIENNYIDGVQGVGGEEAQGFGIYIRKPTDAVISYNHIEDTAHNAIFLAGAVTNAAVSITGNKMVNWDSNNDGEGGRALRSAVNATEFTFTENCMVKTWAGKPTDPNFVKVTNLSETVDLDFDNNYWNSETPDFDEILEDSFEEINVSEYYEDEAMTQLIMVNQP